MAERGVGSPVAGPLTVSGDTPGLMLVKAVAWPYRA
jgi:hypothetical protein